ncbi:DNA-binding bromodomain-containing protein [Rhynchospora pubera]|uniref:DNA-binding bromodomain-containing protein n=1 Tax=Rhynchospora pubera TaxID=906938 RepID=A0AAV8H670_9POAL|nr:DNA-binding bromodomain-containing protein [Rhynchospora pubera]
MGRSGDTDDTEREIWGTWEELLLACAVTRHGTASWDSVAMEVQSRSPFSHLLTPNKCRLRYLHLHRRFSSSASPENAAVSDGESEKTGDPVPSDAGSWVEELRKVRVAELRREVERCDLSIVSLELKVNRLKEERESGSKEADPCGKDEKQDPTVEDQKDDVRSPGSVAAEISGRSCKESNESNSTDLKQDEKAKPGDESGTGLQAGTERTAGEVAKRNGESGESVAESKESSDVQSSASLSTRRRKAVSSGEVEVGPALSLAESQPLVAFLEILRSDKLGSVFERRLESQQSETYQSMIRRHVDLEMIRTKLDISTSSDSYTSATEFYRDLFLLCANALVFFPKSSEEHSAALHIYSLVTKQMNSANLPKPHGSSSSSRKEVKVTDLPKVKADSDVRGPLLEKPAIIVCRKRSSLAKPASAAVGNSTNSSLKEEKQNKGSGLDPDPNLRKTGTTGPRTSKTRSNTTLRGLNSNPSIASNVKSQKQSSDKGSDKSVAASANVAKKRNAVDFLNRLNDRSKIASSKGSQGDSSKKGKTEGKREQSSSKKGGTPPGKRNVGRPPKRPAPSVTPPPAKRLKDEAAKPQPAAKRRGSRRS